MKWRAFFSRGGPASRSGSKRPPPTALVWDSSSHLSYFETQPRGNEVAENGKKVRVLSVMRLGEFFLEKKIFWEEILELG